MPDLLPVTITDAQVLASPLYKALEADGAGKEIYVREGQFTLKQDFV